MLKKEIAQVEHWFHTEAERFMLRHQGLGILLIFMGVPLAALILVTVLRHVFHAPRPYDQMNYYPLISHKPGNSFPSRHTASSVIIAMAFWYVCQPLGIIAAALAVLVGISRVVAGLHYPRDVLAGAAVSLVVGGLGFWVV